jgi:hypothetical protein
MASKQFKVPINLVNLTSDPSGAIEGDIYWNSADNKLRIYYDSAWNDVSSGGGGEGVASDSFKTISVTGQSNVVADSSTDTLSLVAGTNVSITTDAINDSITINSTAALTSVDSITYPDYITFDTTPETVPTATGSIFWDDGDGLLATVLNANVTIGLGQEQVALVKNATGASIAKGKVVYINGAAGQRPTIALSDADTEATSSKTFGLTAEAIADGAEGFVATFGVLRGVNTLGLTAGAALWLSSTAGSYTTTVPAEPAHSVFLGYVVKAHQTAGEIFVNIQNGYELTELHGVVIEADESLTDNEVLAYDTTSGLWKNQTAVEAGLLDTSATEQTKAGNLILSGDLTVATDIFSTGLNLVISNDEVVSFSTLNNNAGISEDTGFTITTNGIATSKVWIFDNSGNLTFPDASNQTTAFLGMSAYSTTNLSEGTNLYYTDERAQDAVGNNLGTGLSYNDSTGAISNSGVLDLTGTANEIVVSASTGSITIGIPDSPIFVTPTIGVATATSINGTTIPSSKTLVVTTDIGSSVQAYSAVLAGINTLGAGTGFLKNTGGTWSYDNSTYAPLASPTFTGTVTIPAGADISGYLTTSSAASTYATTASLSNYQTLDGDLSAIGAISSGVGLLKRVAQDTWTIDTNTYITASSPTINTSIISGTSTFNLINTTATTVNFAGAATALTIGSNDAAAILTLKAPTIVGTATSQDIFNTVATTVNIAGATTTLVIGGTPTGAVSATLFGNTTSSGNTKTINIGTGGASGSVTNINIGSSTSGATGTVSVYPTTTFSGVVNVPYPTSANHATTKSYVDTVAAGINIKTQVVYVSQSNVAGTYTAGTSDSSGGTGVGAYITSNISGALILDGPEVEINQRVLLKNQTEERHNGIYIVTDPGDGDSPYILTRAADFNGETTTNGLIKPGDYIFVTSGTISANDSYVVSQVGTSTSPNGAIKIGTDDILLAQYSGVPSNISTLGYVTTGTWAASPIDKDFIDVEIARTDDPVFTGHVTVPSPTDDTDAANKEYVDDLIFASLPFLPDIIPLDDMRYEFDGIKSRFMPKFEGQMVNIYNPLKLLLTINGIIQTVDFPEYVWQSMLPREGFMVDSDGYIAYSEVPPPGSTFDARVMLGPNVNTKKKGYPFKAVDILLGA